MSDQTVSGEVARVETAHARRHVRFPEEGTSIRDIPRSCPCHWQWSPDARRWLFISARVGCPWHEGGK